MASKSKEEPPIPPAAPFPAFAEGEGAGSGVGKGSKLQLRACALAFRLFEGYIAAKSADASTAYRVIVGALLENYAYADVRLLAQEQLGRILEKTPRMPLGILVEPLMKQMRVWGYTPADLSFHRVLAHHPRLEPAQGLMLLDMMARVCVADERAACQQAAQQVPKKKVKKKVTDSVYISAFQCLVGLLDTLCDIASC
jgi:hypothetical protein